MESAIGIHWSEHLPGGPVLDTNFIMYATMDVSKSNAILKGDKK